MDTNETGMTEICLKNDLGKDFVFTGRIFSECSWYDEKFGIQTRQKLYVTEQGDQIYYIVRSGKEKSRAAYKLTMEDDLCTIHNGAYEFALPKELLKLTVRSLCGIGENANIETEIEETLTASMG